MTYREFTVLLLVCLIWGLHFIVMKLTVGYTADHAKPHTSITGWSLDLPSSTSQY